MNHLKAFYKKLVDFGSSLQNLFLLAVRLLWGFLFFQSGVGKLDDLTSVSEYFYSLNIPFPELNAIVVAWIETIGGAFLILGVLSRLVSLPLIFTMIIAFLTANIDAVKNMIEDPTNLFKQSPFTYLMASLIIFVFGPGKFSIDQLMENLISGKSKIK